MQIAARQAVLHGYRVTVVVDPVLEPDLGNEFDLTPTHGGSRDLSKMAWADQEIRQTERWVVQDIGRIGAKVYPYVFPNREGF